MLKRVLVVAVCAVFVMFATLVSADGHVKKDSNVKTEEVQKVKELFEKTCSQCHSYKNVEKREAYKKFTVQRWSECIDNMKKKGLKISAEDQAKIANYLGTHHFKK